MIMRVTVCCFIAVILNDRSRNLHVSETEIERYCFKGGNEDEQLKQ